MPFLAPLAAIGGAAASAAGAAGMISGTMATVLSVASMGLGMIGSMITGRQEARANAQASKLEARNVETAARQRQLVANEKANRQRQLNEEATSTQVARLGASGVEPLGSPLEAIFADVRKGELAARDYEYEGSNAMLEGANRAAGIRYEAKLNQYKSNQAAIKSMTSSGISLAGKAIPALKTVLGSS